MLPLSSNFNKKLINSHNQINNQTDWRKLTSNRLNNKGKSWSTK